MVALYNLHGSKTGFIFACTFVLTCKPKKIFFVSPGVDLSNIVKTAPNPASENGHELNHAILQVREGTCCYLGVDLRPFEFVQWFV